MTNQHTTHQSPKFDRMNGHQVYLSPVSVACSDCSHVLVVPPLLRDSDPVTMVAYRLYLLGKLLSDPCPEETPVTIDSIDSELTVGSSRTVSVPDRKVTIDSIDSELTVGSSRTVSVPDRKL